MITILLCALIGFGLGLYFVARDFLSPYCEFMDLFFVFTFGVMFAGAGACVGGFIATTAGMLAPSEYGEVSRSELVALADTTELHGDIQGFLFVMAGSIDQEMHYAYYYRTGPTSYRYRSVHHRYVSIFEDEEKTPYVTTFERQIPPSWRRWTIADRDWHEEIHIPKGSILQNYRLDLQ